MVRQDGITIVLSVSVILWEMTKSSSSDRRAGSSQFSASGSSMNCSARSLDSTRLVSNHFLISSILIKKKICLLIFRCEIFYRYIQIKQSSPKVFLDLRFEVSSHSRVFRCFTLFQQPCSFLPLLERHLLLHATLYLRWTARCRRQRGHFWHSIGNF